MPPTASELRNIHAIIALEKETRERRTAIERVTDAVAAAASSPLFIACHVVWFAVWIAYNVASRRPYDPFPFSLLTLVVSLEAIVLTGFVMVSQARMTEQADRRAHLDLQINLLGEQEVTAILKMVVLLADHVGVDVKQHDARLFESLQQLLRPTDIRGLAATVKDELTRVQSEGAGVPASAAPPVDVNDAQRSDAG